MLLAPGEEAGRGAGVGGAGVRVADARGEELDVAPRRRLAGVRHGGGHGEPAGQGREGAVGKNRVMCHWSAPGRGPPR